MEKPDASYTPQIGDVVLVRATITSVHLPKSNLGARVKDRAQADRMGLPIKIAARTPAGLLARMDVTDIESVEAYVIKPGSRIRWWEDGEHHAGNVVKQAGYVYGTVLSVEEAEDADRRPHKDNLWVKVEGQWPRRTFTRDKVQRA